MESRSTESPAGGTVHHSAAAAVHALVFAVAAAALLSLSVATSAADKPGQADLDQATDLQITAESLGELEKVIKLAESALQLLQPTFPAMTAPWTRDEPLPGGDLPKSDMRNGARAAFLAALCRRYPALPDGLLRALAHRYGTRALELLGDAKTPADLGRDFGCTLSEREIEFLVRHEWAVTADDVLWRRTKCGLPMNGEQRDAVRDYMNAVQPTPAPVR